MCHLANLSRPSQGGYYPFTPCSGSLSRALWSSALMLCITWLICSLMRPVLQFEASARLFWSSGAEHPFVNRSCHAVQRSQTREANDAPERCPSRGKLWNAPNCSRVFVCQGLYGTLQLRLCQVGAGHSNSLHPRVCFLASVGDWRASSAPIPRPAKRGFAVNVLPLHVCERLR